MSIDPAPQTPAGWYPDPWSPSTSRYWDGAAWTAHQNPPAAPVSYEPPRAPEGTGWNTPWIWLIVLLPLVSLATLLLIPWSSLFAFDPNMIDRPGAYSPPAMYLTPLLIVINLLSYVIYGLVVFFAYLDYRQLSRMGVPKPFHWAWAFLSSVYVFGRSIVVKQRTGHGMAPLWAEVGMIVLSIIVTSVVMTTLLTSVFEMFREISTTMS